MMADSREFAEDTSNDANNDVATTVPGEDVNGDRDVIDTMAVDRRPGWNGRNIQANCDREDVEVDKKENYKNLPVVMSRAELFADVYKMDYPRRGKAIIINIENFSPGLGCEARTGSTIDANKLESRLKHLGFEVERKNDLTCEEIRSAFKKISEDDHSESDCFVGVIFSHGGRNDKIYGTDGSLETQKIFRYFNGSNCKTLVGKPKLFFIQACRGLQSDSGISVNVIDYKSAFPADATQCEIRIPNEADFLISYSTVPGYVAWRNPNKGSWFIQALVEVLDECGTTSEIVKLLTKVNRVVAFDPRFQAEEEHGVKRQVPSFLSMLTKELYFIPKIVHRDTQNNVKNLIAHFDC